MITKNALWIFGLVAAAVWGLTFDTSPPLKMLVIAFWIFFVVKCRAIQRLKNRTATVSKMAAALQWFLLTPTLDADRFFHAALPVGERPNAGEWMFAVVKIIIGTILFFIAAGQFVQSQEIFAGWLAMIGIAMILHFGLLELIVLWWRFRGRDIRPLMQRPLQAESLSDFWGRRWNTGFRDFAHEHIFRPVCQFSNAKFAALMSFIFSGLIHELAISVPAGGGYGLPFAYFVLQWLGITLERYASLRGWSLRSGLPGWFFAATFLVGPAGLLFPAAFVRGVIVPLIPPPFMLN